MFPQFLQTACTCVSLSRKSMPIQKIMAKTAKMKNEIVSFGARLLLGIKTLGAMFVMKIKSEIIAQIKQAIRSKSSFL